MILNQTFLAFCSKHVLPLRIKPFRQERIYQGSLFLRLVKRYYLSHNVAPSKVQSKWPKVIAMLQHLWNILGVLIIRCKSQVIQPLFRSCIWEVLHNVFGLPHFAGFSFMGCAACNVLNPDISHWSAEITELIKFHGLWHCPYTFSKTSCPARHELFQDVMLPPETSFRMVY